MMTKITWKMLKRGSSYGCVDTLNSNWSHQVYGNSEVVFWKGNTQWFTRRHDTVWKRPKHQVGESENTADQRGLRSEWRNPRESLLSQHCRAPNSFWNFSDHSPPNSKTVHARKSWCKHKQTKPLLAKRKEWRMKRDCEKRSSSLSPVSAVWGLNPWDDGLFHIYVLAWLILVTPSNSSGLPLPTQSGMLRWWATWPKICLNSPDFTLSASFLPQQEGNICSRRGCWEREKGEEIGQTKGVEGCLVSQVPRPPGESDVSSCQVGTLFSLAGRALESSRPWQDLQASWEEHLITKSSSRAKSQ